MHRRPLTGGPTGASWSGRADHVEPTAVAERRQFSVVDCAGAALTELAEDPTLRVGVLTGAGRAFCAGADLKELAAGHPVHDPDHPERGFAGVVRYFVDKPLIAAVNGFALGGGTEIVLACDLAVISEEATLGLPEVTRGLVAAAGGLLRLHRQIPLKIAAETVFTGGRWTLTRPRGGAS